jgi:hypothetical protein
MSPNRVVTVLTPLVFAPLAGWATAWAARNLPGLPELDPTEVTAVFVVGASIAFGKAALWLRGWHLHMQSPDGRVGAVEDDEPLPGPDAFVVPADPQGDYRPELSFEEQPHSENGQPPVAQHPASRGV